VRNRSSSDAGIVILDTNCYKFLERGDVNSRVSASLRAADMRIWPSKMNSLEAVASANAQVRDRSRAIMNRVADGRVLLPFPTDHLKQIGEAIVRGDTQYTVRSQGPDEMLTDAVLAAERQPEAETFLSGMEALFDAALSAARPEVQAALRRLGLLDSWASAADFLDGPWANPENRRAIVDQTWHTLGLPGDPPVDRLLNQETWKMAVDIDGLAMYQRTVLKKQPKRVQRRDLLQLLAMSLSHRRIIVTDDGAFLSAARALLERRYRNARAMHITELLAA